MDRFETFSNTIAVIYRYIQKIKSSEMEAFGLRGTHGVCLYALGKQPEGMTASQLCTACEADKAAISRSIADLEKRGFVKLNRDPEKRSYRTAIFLTEQGQQALTHIQHRVNAALDAVGSDLSEQQRQDMYHCLHIIAENLKAYEPSEENV